MHKAAALQCTVWIDAVFAGKCFTAGHHEVNWTSDDQGGLAQSGPAQATGLSPTTGHHLPQLPVQSWTPPARGFAGAAAAAAAASPPCLLDTRDLSADRDRTITLKS